MFRIKGVYGLIILFFGYLSQIDAQTDSIFWFGAPEVIADHGDRPIRIFCTSTTTDVIVTLSQPANPGFQPIQFNLAQGASRFIDLTPWIDQIETRPNQVQNNGILIEATGLITAYYEVLSFYNPDIFSLKGDNALGNEFWIPGQNHFFNGGYGGIPRSGFIIVATEDNTKVRITPKNSLEGHPAGITFEVILNRGQCFAARAVRAQAQFHVGGDYIQSDKPIAITLKDDSIGLNVGCWDLGGDQIIPTRIIGKEYIVARGALWPDDRFFVTATVDGTNVYINGAALPAITLNAGETGNFPLLDFSAFVVADQPVYVLHVTGWGCELGYGILPPIRCTGSKSVHFSRSTGDPFGLFVFAQSNTLSSFEIDGNSNLLSAADFRPVPGTNGEFSTANIDLSASIQVGVPVNVRNLKGVFHLGIFNGRHGTSSRYGYFSNFGQPKKTHTKLLACPGEFYLLDSKSTNLHLWYVGDSLMSTDSTYGIYADTTTLIKLIAEVNFGCIDTTLYSLVVKKPAEQTLFDSICAGGEYIFGNEILTKNGLYTDTLTAQNGCDSIVYLYFEVNNPSETIIRDHTCFVSDTGWVETYFTNKNGCDSIVRRHWHLIPSYSDTSQYYICPENKVLIQGKWIDQPGTYRFTFQTTLGCDSLWTHIVHLLNADTIHRTMEVCSGGQIEGLTLYKDTVFVRSYLNEMGCDSTEIFDISVLPIPVEYDDISICYSDLYRGIAMLEDTVFIDTFQTVKSCDSILVSTVNVLDLPDISILGDSILCEGDEGLLSGKGGVNYTWSTGSNQIDIGIHSPGLYWVEGVDSEGCIDRDSFWVKTPDLSMELAWNPPICPGINDGIISILDYDSTYRYFINNQIMKDEINGLSPGNYTIRLVDPFGCEKVQNLEFKNPQSLLLTLPDTIIDYLGNTVTIEPKVNLAIDSSLWFPPDYLSCDSCFITKVIVQEGYRYYLKVLDKRGCTTLDSIYVKGINRNLYVPNVFSPNADGVNDKFTLFSNAGYEIISQLKIYSRWGELMYIGNNLPFNDTQYGWDGQHNGQPMNPGVFAFIAVVLRTDGIEEIIYGDVTMIR